MYYRAAVLACVVTGGTSQVFGCGATRSGPLRPEHAAETSPHAESPFSEEDVSPQASSGFSGATLPKGPCREGVLCDAGSARFPYLTFGESAVCFTFQEDARMDCAEELGIVLNPDLPEGPCRRAIGCEYTPPPSEPLIEINGRPLCFLDDDAMCACADEFGVWEETPACSYGY